MILYIIMDYYKKYLKYKNKYLELKNSLRGGIIHRYKCTCNICNSKKCKKDCECKEYETTGKTMNERFISNRSIKSKECNLCKHSKESHTCIAKN